MNVLILTARFGMGHVMAAEALKEEVLLEEKNANIEIVDFMDYMFPKISNGIYGGFNFLVSKFSRLYNAMNEAAGKHSEVPLKKAAVWKIEKLIKNSKADVILVTFPVCSNYIGAYKKMKKCNIPMYTYITDIEAHDEWISDGTDFYFVGDHSTKNTLVKKGVNENQIIVKGIPVRQCFKTSNRDKNEENIKTKKLLIMGGGLGLLPECDKLLKGLSSEKNIEVTLIAGKNRKLKEEIEADFPKINVIGYTPYVNEYMRKADVVITKAGGITTAEAVETETPMFVVDPFLQQEYGNAKYIEDNLIGKVLWGKNNQVFENIMELLENEILIDKMKNNMKNIKAGFVQAGPLEIFNERGNEKCNVKMLQRYAG